MKRICLAALAFAVGVGTAQADMTDGVIKIGVMNDMSGTYSDLSGQGSVIGTFLGVLIQGLIQTYITFDGTLSSWWTKIVTGILLFAFIALQQAIIAIARRSVVSKAGAKP